MSIEDDLEAASTEWLSARLRAALKASRAREKALREALERVPDTTGWKPRPVRSSKGKAAKHTVRVIIPDSHGAHIDLAARDGFLRSLDDLTPDEVVWLGDHLDCGGTFTPHQRNYTHEMTESYSDDVAAGNEFLDLVQERCPNARHYYLEGNHEQWVERWAARNFDSFEDARLAVEALGPEGQLKLKQREIEYFRMSEFHHNLAVRGVIRLGKCHFVHGMSHAKHADHAHLQRVGSNVVFGHVHRVLSVGERTVESEAHGAWCPGTLAKLQPLYRHTSPTSWQHGFGVQFVNQSTGTFATFLVPIVRGESLLRTVIDAVDTRRRGKRTRRKQ